MGWRLTLITLWLVRGGTMSEQTSPVSIPKPVIVGEAGPELFIPAKPVRTIHDVEADLALAGTELAHHRSRRGELTNKAERIAQRPALMVHEVNWLLEEWSALHRA